MTWVCGWVGGWDCVCACVDPVMAAPGVGLLAPTSRVNSNASTKEDERTQLEKEALVSPHVALAAIVNNYN